MTRFTPLWQQAGSYPANVDRALLAALWPVPAAVGAAAAAVTNTMNVSIPPGTIAVPLQSGQHTALCRWDAAEVVSSPAAPAAGMYRNDLVVCQVRDPALDSGVNNDFIFLVIPGTPAATAPPTPAVPANAAPVSVYQLTGGIANLNGVTISDARRGIGLAPVFASTAERDAVWPSPPNGSQCVTADSATAWRRIAGAWSSPMPRGLLGWAFTNVEQTGIMTAPVVLDGTLANYTIPAGGGTRNVLITANVRFRKAPTDSTADTIAILTGDGGAYLAVTAVSHTAPGNCQTVMRAVLNHAAGASHGAYLQAYTGAGYTNAGERIITVEDIGPG